MRTTLVCFLHSVPPTLLCSSGHCRFSDRCGAYYVEEQHLIWFSCLQGKTQELEGKLQEKELEIEALRAALAKSGANQATLNLPVEKVPSMLNLLTLLIDDHDRFMCVKCHTLPSSLGVLLAAAPPFLCPLPLQPHSFEGIVHTLGSFVMRFCKAAVAEIRWP